MEIKQKLFRNIDIVNHNYVTSFNSTLIKENNLNYRTSIILALPSIENDFKEGNFKVDYNGNLVDVEIFKITDKAQDYILSLIYNTKMPGLTDGILSFSPELRLPPEMYTDNRGKYPYYCARIIFPFLLADWLDPSAPSGIKLYDYKRAQITGGYKYEDKIEALFVLNKLFSSPNYNKKLLVYEDVTLFIENYFSKHDSQLICQKISFFASNKAYKNAIEYFFGSGSKEYICDIIEKQSIPEILTETDLLEYILHILNTIAHPIENRRWIDPFWKGKRKVKIDKKYVEIPNEPKIETQIQPTLYVLFHFLLDPRITVDRETEEGAGKLDFKFRYTTNNKKQLTLCLEFKLGHHKKIKDGLTKQLPAYLKANESTIGIFTVMWFKDENGILFKEPTNRTKVQMLEFLEETSNYVYENEGLNIKTFMIDASIKKSASNL